MPSVAVPRSAVPNSVVVPHSVDRWQQARDDDLASVSRTTRRLGLGLRSTGPDLFRKDLLAPISGEPLTSGEPLSSGESGLAPGGSLLERLLADPDPLAARMTAFWVHHLGHVAGEAEHLRRHGTGQLIDVAPGLNAAAFVRCLYEYFVGSAPSAQETEALTAAIEVDGHDVRTLIGTITSANDLGSKVRTRRRHDYEWILGAAWALGIENFAVSRVVPSHSWGRGRVPPDATIEIARRAAVLSWAMPDKTRRCVEAEPAAVLARCGIFDPTWTTWSQLQEAYRRFGDRSDLLELLFALALTSREFAWL